MYINRPGIKIHEFLLFFLTNGPRDRGPRDRGESRAVAASQAVVTGPAVTMPNHPSWAG